MQRRTFIGGLVAILTGPWFSPDSFAEQTPKLPVIGFLGGGPPAPNAAPLVALRQGLGEAGYVADQTVKIEYRWAEGHYDRLPTLAIDLASRKVAVIVAGAGTAGLRAVRDATPTIPIVFVTGNDPAAAGLVASLARPGGNLTGFSIFSRELYPKRLELLSELVPQPRVSAFLLNPNINPPAAGDLLAELQAAATAKGVELHVLRAATESEIETAFVTLVRLHAGGLVVGSDPFFNSQRDLLLALAVREGVPAIYDERRWVELGGLISYGPSQSAVWRQAGAYVGRILAGAKPADLPVQQPTTFELVVNLKTAKALGLTVPPSILARADEVIE
jgi:putative tryptophan/tyrosine transport system substrate-binding protein